MPMVFWTYCESEILAERTSVNRGMHLSGYKFDYFSIPWLCYLPWVNNLPGSNIWNFSKITAVRWEDPWKTSEFCRNSSERKIYKFFGKFFRSVIWNLKNIFWMQLSWISPPRRYSRVCKLCDYSQISYRTFATSPFATTIFATT